MVVILPLVAYLCSYSYLGHFFDAVLSHFLFKLFVCHSFLKVEMRNRGLDASRSH